MIVKCLMEDTTEHSDIKAEHGLSLYIETENHKILFDMGQTDAFADNAQKLGVDLSAVDIAILSHGHYDHSGGLEKFLKINDKAYIYMSKYVFEPHYNGTEKYIGIDQSLRSERFVYTGEVYDIDDGLTLLSCNKMPKLHPIESFGLNTMRDGRFVSEDFRHEQYLLIKEGTKRVLISGCSHKGILNIAEWFSPDILVGGFHFVKLDPQTADAERLQKAADELSEHKTVYYTCHCTGVAQYEFMKKTLKENLRYLSAGQTLEF